MVLVLGFAFVILSVCLFLARLDRLLWFVAWMFSFLGKAIDHCFCIFNLLKYKWWPRPFSQRKIFFPKASLWFSSMLNWKTNDILQVASLIFNQITFFSFFPISNGNFSKWSQTWNLFNYFSSFVFQLCFISLF